MRLYLLILIVGAVASCWGPWWVLSPVCFVLCWWQCSHELSAFWMSAWSGITLWMGYTLYLHITAEVDLAQAVAGIFLADARILTDVPGIVFMSGIAAIIIGVVSGFSGLAGIKIRRYFNRHSQ